MFPVAEGNLRHDLNSGMSVARGGVLVVEFGRNDLVVHMNQEHWRAIYKGEHRGCRWTGRDKFVRVTHYAICHSFIHCSITGDVYNQSFLFKKEKYLKQPGGRFDERVWM